MKPLYVLLAALATAGPATAHHGWGSYDAANPVTITVRGADKEWTVTLAPMSRMSNRGATADVIAQGKTVAAFGYPSTVEKDEMRAERITIDGKTYEMR